MKNFIQPGMTLAITAAADRVSGQGVRAGMLFGVATHDALSGEALEICTTGVFELPKTSAQAWTVGAALYWTGSQCSTAAGTGNIFIGVAAAIAVNPSSTGIVRLNGSAPVAAT